MCILTFIQRLECEFSFHPFDNEDLCLKNDSDRTSNILLNTRIGRGVLGVDIPVLVKNLSFQGTVSIQLTTMTTFPYVKLATISLPQLPEIDFVLKPLKSVDIMDVPGLSQSLHFLIRDTLTWLMVHPNSYTLDLDLLLNGHGCRYDLYLIKVGSTVEAAIGVIMIKLQEGRDLKNAEALGISDPYVSVLVGGKAVARSRVVESNLNRLSSFSCTHQLIQHTGTRSCTCWSIRMQMRWYST